MGLQAARYNLVRKRPYLASALWALVPVEKPGLQTLAVDKHWRLYYDPEVVHKWHVAELTGVLYHEVSHLLRNHAKRLKRFPNRVANIAADLEINDDLREEKDIRLPDDALYPEMFGLEPHLLAEEYIPQLPHIMNVSGKNAGNTSGTQPSKVHEIDDHIPRPTAGNCGSCATGQQAPWELPASAAPAGIAKIEGELIRRKIAQDILDAYDTSRGTVPEHWVRWAKSILKPKVDWRKILAATIRASIAHEAGVVDYTYSRPSRRQAVVSNVILPALRKPKINVAVVVDTSGSIDEQLLAQALAEIRGILRAMQTHVTILSCDAQVHTVKKVFSPRQLRNALLGGGGTNMGEGIQEAIKLKPKPDIIIVLTDGFTPWPEKSPKVKVIVGLLSRLGNAPHWARTVLIQNNSGEEDE
ncbi:MAG: VWA domain-containing protein [Desulfurococcales archaeon]|nr:VWA domain-containing protein [Desulfurococcales archaeon]